MATTTNFGWETPDDTDLVKDGAAAMRTLGNSIDTSLVDLKGGTTGQVLSKASNTDMDFSWVAQDDSNAIQNAIVDAKGDIITATAADTPARLAVGSNGYTLIADSSAATGLAYGSSALANPVINGGYDIWQRGTSFSNPTSSGTAWSADRWQAFRGGFATGITTARQSSGFTGIEYSARVQRANGNTGTDGLYLLTNFESTNSIPYAGKTITFSFYAKAGANFSSSGGTLNALLVSGTGTNENYISGSFTGGADVVNQNPVLTTSWQRFSYTASVASTATQLAIRFYYAPTGTAGANDWFEVTGVQIDLGSTALPFRRSGGTIQGELAACQRYYIQLVDGLNQMIANGSNYSATEMDAVIHLPVPMRTTPTIVQTSGTDYFGFLRNGATDLFNSFTIGNTASSVSNAVGIYNATEISGTAGQAGFVRSANASARFALSAEL